MEPLRPRRRPRSTPGRPGPTTRCTRRACGGWSPATARSRPTGGCAWPSGPRTSSGPAAAPAPPVWTSPGCPGCWRSTRARAPRTWAECARTRIWWRPHTAPRLAPLIVPQLKTITVGGAATGGGIESGAFRSGVVYDDIAVLDILTGAGEVVTAAPGGPARGPLLRVRQLLRQPGLRDPVAGAVGTGPALRRAATSALRRSRAARDRDGRDQRRARARRRAGRLPRRGRLHRRRAVPDARAADRRPGPDQRLHRPPDLLPVDPGSARPTA